MTMKIIQRKISELKEANYNPRKITDKELNDLKNSIESFGIQEPAIINMVKGRENIIISGHQRIKVASMLGKKTFPCIELKLNQEKEKELNLRMNKNTGSFNFDLLIENFEFDQLIKVGFDKNEIDFDEYFKDKQEKTEIPELKTKSITKLNDIYVLNQHKLYCGVASDESSYEILFQNKRMDLYFTDPPYGVSYADKNKFLNNQDEGNRIQKQIINDHLTVDECAELWEKTFKITTKYMNEYSSYYICSPRGGDLFMMMMMIKKSGLQLKHQIIWAKNNHVLGRVDYNYKHEPIFYGWHKKHKFYNGGNQNTSVWEYDKPLKSDLHPTMKPVELVENAILNSSLMDQIVYDSFLGSGTTLIASEKNDRICYGMELDPCYCDVIVKRFMNYMNDNSKEYIIKKNGIKINQKELLKY